MKTLDLHMRYTREDIHQIFSPETKFTPQAGTWGLQGIVRIPQREKDFVFFVTYGQSQGDHDFDEGISSNGVLTWQSQPSQGFKSKIIQQLIHHDYLTENIYLFLRENKGEDYKYYGRLKYAAHDATREKPVYFQWQLLDWDSGNPASSENPTLPIEKLGDKPPLIKNLVHSEELPSKKRLGTTKELFRVRKAPDYAARDANNREVGLEGELLVLGYERARLAKLGRKDLADNITHTSVIEGDGAGYDIKSFNKDGSARYIEVKATRGSIDADFYMSPNEIKFSQLHASNFYLYRVYNMRNETGAPHVYIIEGNVLDNFEASPTNFRMNFSV